MDFLIACLIEPVIPQSQSLHDWYNISKDFFLLLFFGIMAAVAAYYIFYSETEIAITTRDGKQLFHHLKMENQQLSNDFQNDYEKINDSLEELKILTQSLMLEF